MAGTRSHLMCVLVVAIREEWTVRLILAYVCVSLHEDQASIEILEVDGCTCMYTRLHAVHCDQ